MLYDQKWDLDQAGRDLLDAARLLQERGWCQGRMGFKNGPHCVLGALFAIMTDATGSMREGRTVNALNRLAATAGCGDCAFVILWNDSPGMTKERVISTMYKAAGVTVPA